MEASHNGNGAARQVRRRRWSARQHFLRDGQRAAVLRAITAARGYLDGTFPTLCVAAQSCGTNPTYVRAAITLLRAEDPLLLHRVLRGWYPLVKTAAQIEPRVKLVRAYHSASDEDRVAWARAEGAERVFDVLVQAAR
jgi:hypothetical protein